MYQNTQNKAKVVVRFTTFGFHTVKAFSCNHMISLQYKHSVVMTDYTVNNLLKICFRGTYKFIARNEELLKYFWNNYLL